VVGLFVLGIVATPFLFAGWVVNRVFEHRTRIKQLEANRYVMPPALPPAYDPQVEQRLANLEAVICDLDYDLAQRVRGLDPGRAA
jgi:hypothetical protein